VAILSLLLFPQLVLGAAIRIMPLGDSITYDNNVGDQPPNAPRPIGLRTGYRQPLWLTLKAEGYDVDFVGSNPAGQIAVPAFDPDNEGHPGYKADQVAGSVYGWLQLNPADVILLHIGTNDLNQNPNDIANTVADVKNILDKIDTYEQDEGVAITVVLARIINTAAYGCSLGYTQTFNTNLAAMASGRASDKIIMVDMECGADLDYGLDTTPPYAHDMYDNLHPNDNGYAKMADVWFDGLLKILPVAKPVPVPQVANPGAVVTLDGSGSTDALGTIVSYSWRQTGGSPTVSLSNATTAKASFTAPETYTGASPIFELTITDNRGFTHSDSCVVDVNGAPRADAGPDQRVKAQVSVVLDGSNSNDADGSIATYQWTQTAGTPVVALTNATSAKASFVAPPVGPGGAALTFRLTVTDNKGATKSDTLVVTVNGPPVADAGPDQQVQSGATVVLDGSGSADEEVGALTYSWMQISGPPVVLSNSNSSRPSFQAPSVGSTAATLTFLLKVTDSAGLQAEDSCSATVTAPGQSSTSGGSEGGGGGGCFITAAGQ
jgi:hypothetical protein